MTYSVREGRGAGAAGRVGGNDVAGINLGEVWQSEGSQVGRVVGEQRRVPSASRASTVTSPSTSDCSDSSSEASLRRAGAMRVSDRSFEIQDASSGLLLSSVTCSRAGVTESLLSTQESARRARQAGRSSALGGHCEVFGRRVRVYRGRRGSDGVIWGRKERRKEGKTADRGRDAISRPDAGALGPLTWRPGRGATRLESIPGSSSGCTPANPICPLRSGWHRAGWRRPRRARLHGMGRHTPAGRPGEETSHRSRLLAG